MRCSRRYVPACAPGVDWRDVHLRTHELTGKLLREADITNCEADEAVASGVTSVFLPHGVGHLLGLEVHDAGGFMASPEGGDIPRPDGHPFLRLTRVLQKGFVVTVEPGIYFIDQLLDAAPGRRAGEQDQLVESGEPAQVRRHPHRGQCRDHRHRLREPDTRCLQAAAA